MGMREGRWTGVRADEQPDRETDGRTGVRADEQPDGETDRLREGGTDGRTDRRAAGRTDGRKDGSSSRRAGKQPDGEMGVRTGARAGEQPNGEAGIWIGVRAGEHPDGETDEETVSAVVERKSWITSFGLARLHLSLLSRHITPGRALPRGRGGNPYVVYVREPGSRGQLFSVVFLET